MAKTVEKNILKKKDIISIEVLGYWNTDFDDIRCNAIIKKNDLIANVIVSYDEKDIEELTKVSIVNLKEDNIKNALAILIDQDIDTYPNLPKISQCSPLLTEIYDDVCESDATMCYITEEDWKEFYSDKYTSF